MTTMPEERVRDYTEEEATALVGRLVKTTVPFSGVPSGTTGRVVRADQVGRGKWDVVIQWNLPRDPPSITEGVVGDEHVTFVKTGRPLEDWFTRAEYQRYLVELLA